MPSPTQPGSPLELVLVVEDDPLVSEIIVAMLDTYYETATVGTAEAALAYIEGSVTGGHPSRADLEVILLDWLLPGGGSSRVLLAAEHQSVPVVLISGDPEPAAPIGSIRHFLPKPFGQAELLNTLTAARLTKRRAGA